MIRDKFVIGSSPAKIGIFDLSTGIVQDVYELSENVDNSVVSVKIIEEKK